MDARTDVLIVGAGPAGSVAALVLARAGLRVRVIDRARFPRDKLCGDTVNPGSLALLERLGLADNVRAAAVPVTGMLVTGPNGVQVAADYPDGVSGAALTRRHFDQQIVDAAAGAGAAVEDGVRVIRPSLASGIPLHVDGVWVHWRGRDHRLPARVVIAADGRASPLGRSLGITRFARAPRRWAFGAYFDGLDGLTRRGEMHVRGWGYIGIAPLAGAVANVCVVTGAAAARRALPGDGHTRRPGLSAPYDERILHDAIAAEPALRDRFARARRVSPVAVLGPLAVETAAAGAAGLLLAGDAAGFIDPVTGDGLRFAVQGGVLAAEHAQRELQTGLPQYTALLRARRREFSNKWRVNRLLRTLVGSPTGIGLAAALASVWSAPIETLIAVAGDVRLAREYARECPAPEGFRAA